ERSNRINVGRSMPATSCGWPGVSRSVGCVGRMSVPGPCWAPSFFPQGQFNRVPPEQVQEQFRQWYLRWGLPEEVRRDNGHPWGGWYDLPTTFALWLIGLGLKVHFNPARQPQENGVIERFNGLGQRWAEVSKCRSVAEAQAHLDEVDEIQRE